MALKIFVELTLNTNGKNRENLSETNEVKLKFLAEEPIKVSRGNSNRYRNNFTNKDRLGLVLITNSLMHLSVLVILFLMGITYFKLARKPAPSLVQLSSGDAIAVKVLGNKERTPEVVKKFALDTMTTMMNWTGYLPPVTPEDVNNPIVDPGVMLKDENGATQGKVTTAAWESSFALSGDFRTSYLKKLIELTPNNVFSGKVDVVLVPLYVREPIQIEEGKWKVNLIANLMVFKEDNKLGKIIPFNKEIFLRAVEAPEYLQKYNNKLAEIITKVRQSGLEIYGIREFKLEDLKR
ncbi:MAG: hypothetical protein ACRC2R_20675 [Xenococcaceae cyanobacterium]